LEIYSRYSRVEKASGEAVTLNEYLEEVWAAVSREALGMIFEGGDGSGLEEDARLTAMWLWTLFAGADNGDSNSGNNNNEGETDEDKSPKSTLKGFVLEYDAARKIAQGMGVKKLENLPTLVEVKGDKARLLPVSERTSYLFGQGSPTAKRERKKKKEQQTTLSGGIVSQAEETGPSNELSLPSPSSTVLDRLHQAMLLFSNGRSDALKRFIEEDIAQDQRLWSLAQSLSALYPAGSEERRWVEGVLTRKKSLGL
jgi:putative DNA methylase